MTYAVIMQYPGDGQLEEHRVEFFDHLDRAVSYRDGLDDDMFKVFRVEPMNESALWDWGVRKPGEEPLVYVNERSARGATRVGGLELVKRRCGGSEWVAGDAA